jgi:hypothetical protein
MEARAKAPMTTPEITLMTRSQRDVIRSRKERPSSRGQTLDDAALEHQEEE